MITDILLQIIIKSNFRHLMFPPIMFFFMRSLASQFGLNYIIKGLSQKKQIDKGCYSDIMLIKHKSEDQKNGISDDI